MAARKKLTIALAGNPNSGKTTTFNNITGTRQKVGNWPGVTVEKKEGHVRFGDYDLTVVDLPGTYSLTTFSIEEIVARSYILENSPDVVVDIIDSSNLERSLYLATQLRELDAKVLFVLNMADLAKDKGIVIDEEKLSSLLEVPVISTVGNRNEGTAELLKNIIEAAESGQSPRAERRVRYSRDIEDGVAVVRDLLQAVEDKDFPYNPRWTAIKLIEADEVVRDMAVKALGDQAGPILEETARQRERISNLFDDEPEILMTEQRYGFIAGIVREVVKRSSIKRVDVSRNIDLLLTNRVLGFPIFFFFIWAMFQLTFTLGAYPQAWIEHGVELLSLGMTNILPSGMIQDLVVNGIIAGVGSVLVFLPNILILFFCIALFEDTGYMARAAFLMDKVMHLVGLHGKSFIPMLMGFGCNVPAIMAARTLENEKDRILTILINPFMSCSARLPVYVLLAGAFFAEKAGTVIFSIYLLGIVLAIVMGRIFRNTLLKGSVAPFVMELPPYRAPRAKSLMIHMWDRSKMFLKKMGGVILVGSIIVWALSSFPNDPQLARQYEIKKQQVEKTFAVRKPDASKMAVKVREMEKEKALAALEIEYTAAAKENSYLGRIGKFFGPVFAPVGIDWKGGVALFTGFVAKEIVISTLGVLHATKDDTDKGLAEAMKKSGMTPLSAFSMMAFILLYVPCIATVSAIKQETNSWKWTAFSIGYSTTLAWVVAFIIYQGGQLLGLG
ncbi:ferrous iron transport protein B [Desulfatibacillum aliphaticivorans]|uniref:ferrous iron transport protein B n=1 Tax=Desulfatibacillum aliphaticivorans TaxID=218208 RepID=UPI000413053B|nr:ferrous iron transport protein B [Desulfatibacillum aliphaticivorans]